jgi:hypothetical protein
MIEAGIQASKTGANRVNPPAIGIPAQDKGNPASNYLEIRRYGTPESRHLIAALHNVLSKLN